MNKTQLQGYPVRRTKMFAPCLNLGRCVCVCVVAQLHLLTGDNLIVYHNWNITQTSTNVSNVHKCETVNNNTAGWFQSEMQVQLYSNPCFPKWPMSNWLNPMTAKIKVRSIDMLIKTSQETTTKLCLIDECVEHWTLSKYEYLWATAC